jgi:hypothetical protein
MNKTFTKSFLFSVLCIAFSFNAYAGDFVGSNQDMQSTKETGAHCINGFDPVNNISCSTGFDPARLSCADPNGNGLIDPGECWNTSVPAFPNQGVDTRMGNGVIMGGSGAALGQTATQTINDGPHFTTKFYNAPSATGTTYTSGVTSTPSASLREQHNEFGFEVVIDKKTDPLEPYYLKFYIPYTTVDSTQLDTTGEMSGVATGTYSKEITEMDPNNPGVFNRYTITGNFRSNGANSSYGCDPTKTPDCSVDVEGSWRSNWP